MDAYELIKKAIKEYSMPNTDQKILVGFSGGGDSVCLLSVLYELGYKLTAAHLNHNMRATAERDMLFCEKFCREKGIDFVSHTVPKDSLKNELEARKARYDFFYKVMKEKNIKYLATAHNKNDFSESVILHLLRGASLDGISGISPNYKNIIRPLILVKKSEVLEYLNNNNIPYMRDETNEQDIYTRNKIRNNLIPWIEKEINPKIIDTLFGSAELFKEDSEFLHELSYDAFLSLKKDSGIKTKELKKQKNPIKSRVIELLWKEKSGIKENLSKVYIDAVFHLLEKENGKEVHLPFGFEARVERDILYIQKREKTDYFEEKLVLGEYVFLDKIGKKVGIFESEPGIKLGMSGEDLWVRQRKNGDKFKPVGLSGTKSVSDFLTDIKMPKNERDKVPVITKDGQIVAVGDKRISEDFKPSGDKKNIYLRIMEI